MWICLKRFIANSGVKAALEDVSMQAYVARVVEKAVKNVPLPEGNHRSGKSRNLSDGW
jgi:hypothetical protein